MVLSMAPRLLSHLPVATEEAFRQFKQIDENMYQHSGLGKCRDAWEITECGCQYRHGIDPPSEACGNGSHCINRLTQVECPPGTCRCGMYCLNQRFQRRQYADVEVIKTERKGFGLRACCTIDKDAFILEYVGDVINTALLTERMRRYAEEGLTAFYLMMLQKNEFLDATKRGGIGRFVNHSCAPNCYVTRWSVGSHVRMGVFAKRVIVAGEELTFNYNVDRYGHEEQPCYCAEPNCVGFIGGKTQTDIRLIDDDTLDALGLTGEERTMPKNIGKTVGTVEPISNTGMSGVCQALRRLPCRSVLIRLLKRINMTMGDPTSLRTFLRLRGMSLLTETLRDNDKDEEVIMLVLQCLSIMPLMNNGKVEDSGVEEPVRACVVSCAEETSLLAQKLLGDWDKLPRRHRIAKRAITESLKPTMAQNPGETPPQKKQKRHPPRSTKSIPPAARTKKAQFGPLTKHSCEPAAMVEMQQSDEYIYGVMLQQIRDARFTDRAPSTNEVNQSTAKAKTSANVSREAEYEVGYTENMLRSLVFQS